MPGEQEPPPYEVLAALVASLRRELAEMAGVLARARTELAGARERIAGLKARLNQNPRNSPRPPSGEGPAKPAPNFTTSRSTTRSTAKPSTVATYRQHQCQLCFPRCDALGETWRAALRADERTVVRQPAVAGL
jgi:hypothetical protein